MEAILRALFVTALLLLAVGAPSSFADQDQPQQPSRLRSPEPPKSHSKSTQPAEQAGHPGRLLDQRDWDHRKPGRDWRMRNGEENLGH